MSEAVARLAEAGVEARVVSVKELAKRMRAELKKAVRQAWATPAGVELANALAGIAYEYGLALQEEAERLGLSAAYKRIAKEYDISRKYKMVWGKL